MFELKCLPGILIGEGNVGIQQQEKYVLRIRGGEERGDESNLKVKNCKFFF